VPGTEPAEAGTPNHLDQSTLPNHSPAAGVGAFHQPLPPFLRARILAQVDAGNDQRRGWSSARIQWVAATVGLVAGLAFLCLVWLDWLGPTSAPSAFEVPDPARPGGESLRLALLDPSATDRLKRWSATLENPFANEMASAVADGQRLFASVVQSCVPEPTARAILERTSDLVGLRPRTSSEPR
jgi:hypothetical protein